MGWKVSSDTICHLPLQGVSFLNYFISNMVSFDAHCRMVKETQKKFLVVMCVLIPHGYADSMLDQSLRFVCTKSKERKRSSEYIIYLT